MRLYCGKQSRIINESESMHNVLSHDKVHELRSFIWSNFSQPHKSCFTIKDWCLRPSQRLAEWPLVSSLVSCHVQDTWTSRFIRFLYKPDICWWIRFSCSSEASASEIYEKFENILSQYFSSTPTRINHFVAANTLVCVVEESKNHFLRDFLWIFKLNFLGTTCIVMSSSTTH